MNRPVPPAPIPTRPRLSREASDARRPLPPDVLVGGVNEIVHDKPRRVRAARTVKVKRPHTHDPPPSRGPDPSPEGTNRTNPIPLAVALGLLVIFGSFGVWQALGRPSKVWTVTCPDGSTYRATYASPTEGMLKIQDQVGRVMVLPGTCKAVQE